MSAGVKIWSPRRQELFQIPDDGVFPGSSRPAFVYREVVTYENTTKESALETLNEWVQAHAWRVDWLHVVFKRAHYHSTTDEVLVGYRGDAELELGSPQSNLGRRITLEMGDMLYIPAGVAHRAVRRSKNFLVFGLYPGGRTYDILYDKPGDREQALQNIARIRPPVYEPLFGTKLPLKEAA